MRVMGQGMRSLLLLPIVTALLINAVGAYVQVSLNGNTWTVSNKEKGIHYAAIVPGSMYTAILPQKGKANPLYRDNDERYSWIGMRDWSYMLQFSVPSYILNGNAIVLVCEGLDTFANISVNNWLVGVASNMFVLRSFNIKPFLKKGNNTIHVNFTSAVTKAAYIAKNLPYIVPPESPPPEQHGENHVNLIRKEQCSFSWDWGPSFPTQGIWKPIYLNAFGSAILDKIAVVASKEGQKWRVTVESFFNVISNSVISGKLTFSIPDLNIQCSQTIKVSSDQKYQKYTINIPETTKVQLWWPNGYGSQKLYTLTANFSAGLDASSKSVKIGFRTTQLQQVPVSGDTKDGLSFYFRVNNIPIFLKGSNWIPANSFQELITPEHIRFLLQSSVDVGMNTMRVWGGGVYESDEFYEIADELGIMIWQDLMFSVAMYPTFTGFINSVAAEITQQIERLKHHPSILLWAGSNENEKALRQNWFGTQSHYTLYYHDFLKLYVDTIMPIVTSQDSSREYLVSSPTNGAESVKEGYVAKEPWSELYGDIHYYDYAADQWNAAVFRIPRMASEYGIQAWCNPESLSSVFELQDYDMNSSMVNHRQHHPGGNSEMEHEVAMHMNLPTYADEKHRFTDFIYLTQINQAMSMRAQTEHYRRFQSTIQSDGRGLTMGALYWQLNDIWQAPTWASIDFEGGWKMLHYYAKSFFSPILVSPYLKTNNTLDVFLVVDQIPVVEDRVVQKNGKETLTFRPMTHFNQIIKSAMPLGSTFKTMQSVVTATNGFLKVYMYKYSSLKSQFSWIVPYSVDTTAKSIFQKTVSTLLFDSGCPSRKECFLYFEAIDHNKKVLSTSWFTLSYPNVAELPQARVAVKTVSKVSTGVYDIRFSTDAVALYVWLSSPSIPGRFSDNGFLMISSTMTVQFYTNSNVTPEALRMQLKVKSLTDVK